MSIVGPKITKKLKIKLINRLKLKGKNFTGMTGLSRLLYRKNRKLDEKIKLDLVGR